ncbi:unnamed protein product, partial [Meganyctiphanes norvegica]
MSPREKGIDIQEPVSTKDVESSSKDENEERGNWSSKWDYFLSLAGFAIGIGNVWRFPYLCYRNGGGAFLIPYLIMLFLVGIPLFFLESALGQFSSSGCLSLYSVCPLFKGTGYASLIVTLIASTYYSVVVAYPIVFFFHSLQSELPWESCGNPWNTANCTTTQLMLEASQNNITDRANFVSASDEFFHNYILEISPSITHMDGLVWPIVGATAFVWIFCFLCIFKGVKIVGKVVWFTTTFPFVMLFILFIRGVTLPGAWTGIEFYIYPKWEKLATLKVWADAAVQIFFSLGPGFGSIITMGSYNKYRNNSLKDAILVPVLNCATSIFAGFVVFSVLGFMAHRTGTTVDKVTSAGPALAFITYPEALSLMPMAPLWSALFFAMLFFLGIDSVFVQIESMVVSITDEFPQLRPKRGWVTFFACVVMFLASLFCCTRGGMYVLQLLDWYSASQTIIIACLCEIIVFGFIYGTGRVVRDLQVMMRLQLPWPWYAAWVAITPALLLFIFINVLASNTSVSYRGQVFPDWIQGIGWCTAASSMSAIPIYMMYYIISNNRGSIYKCLKGGLCATEDWGPALEHHKKEWLKICTITKATQPTHRLMYP